MGALYAPAHAVVRRVDALQEVCSEREKARKVLPMLRRFIAYQLHPEHHFDADAVMLLRYVRACLCAVLEQRECSAVLTLQSAIFFMLSFTCLTYISQIDK